jgi:hypothetical protein
MIQILEKFLTNKHFNNYILKVNEDVSFTLEEFETLQHIFHLTVYLVILQSSVWSEG